MRTSIHQKRTTLARTPLILLALCLGGGLLSAASAAATDLMLPQVYQERVEVSGWLMSEKLDGVRASWDGHQLRSKQGNLFHPPAAFIQGLPPFPLEGELWGGRGSFEQTVGIVRREKPCADWLKLKFAIFDLPETTNDFTTRMRKAKDWFDQHPSSHAFLIPQILVRDRDHLRHELDRIERLGGEGLIVRQPHALYTPGRSAEILKVKSYQDAEARVIAQLPGKGRNQGRMGALLVELDDGTRFKIGSGFSDAERESPPAPGTLITYKYYGRFQSGLPKFPSFLRIRSDQNL
ncbi:DNA ligase [Geopsychrobacter electrodiphilus]|uniref:DNA ligase n=1 Tax=Geopsychrobacter electrodiphilus TaxID=225196 RepID=UPI00036F44C5|nr:DNA ligase [Geopsychrobacter electrodiphilus]